HRVSSYKPSGKLYTTASNLATGVEKTVVSGLRYVFTRSTAIDNPQTEPNQELPSLDGDNDLANANSPCPSGVTVKMKEKDKERNEESVSVVLRSWILN